MPIPPQDYIVFVSDSGAKYWKAQWIFTNPAGSDFGYWGDELVNALTNYAILIDKVVVGSWTAASVKYYLQFFQSSTNKGTTPGPMHTTTLTQEYKDFDGPYGPMVLDNRPLNYAFVLGDSWDTFGAADDFLVALSGRALPPFIDRQPTSVSVEAYKWPLERRR